MHVKVEWLAAKCRLWGKKKIIGKAQHSIDGQRVLVSIVSINVVNYSFIRQRQKNDSVLIPHSGSNLFADRKQSTISTTSYHQPIFPSFHHDSTFPPSFPRPESAPYSMTHDTPIILRAAPSQNVIKPIQIANNGGLIAHRRVYLAVRAVCVPPASPSGGLLCRFVELSD